MKKHQLMGLFCCALLSLTACSTGATGEATSQETVTASQQEATETASEENTAEAAVEAEATSAEETTESAETEVESAENATEDTVETGMASPAVAEAQGQQETLTAIFDLIKKDYFPGTEGCALYATSYSAQLADCFAEFSMDKSAVSAAVNTYVSTLDDASKATFKDQLAGIVETSEGLTSDEAEGFIAGCGYHPTHFPWDAAKTQDCFSGLNF